MAIVALEITLIVLNLSNVVLHSIGFFLMVHLHLKNSKSIQRVFLIGLSMTEVLSNSLVFVLTFPWLLPYTEEMDDTMSLVSVYLSIVYDYLVDFTFYMTMAYVTIDRLVCSLLNIKYPIYCRPKKAVFLMAGTWGFGIIVTITLSFVYRFYPNKRITRFFVYSEEGDDSEFVVAANQTFSCVFILIAVFSYAVIFRKFVNAQRRRTMQQEAHRRSVFQIFRHSGFFIPVLLVVTWILFNFIPNTVFLHYIVHEMEMAESLETGLWILFAIADLSDGTIYIFLQKDVRTLLLRKFCCYSSSQAATVDSSGVDEGNGGQTSTVASAV